MNKNTVASRHGYSREDLIRKICELAGKINSIEILDRVWFILDQAYTNYR